MPFNKETNKNYLAQVENNKKFGPDTNRPGQVSFPEAVPKYAQRLDVESIITASGISKTVGKHNTNAQITIGKDRWPQDPLNSETSNKPRSPGQTMNSGYASYHNAGAIDLVVGRGAPYPVEITGGPGHLAPLYNTVKSKVEDKEI